MFSRMWLNKLVLFVALLVPALSLLWRMIYGELGAEPVETLHHETGQWGLRILIMTLAITPLRRVTGQTAWLHLRRMLGLYAFFYIFLHLAIYLVLEISFDPYEIEKDLLKRPYMMLGFASFLLMLPMAITSNSWSMKRLGRNWKRLHKAMYVLTPMALLHFLLATKADFLEPLIYIYISLPLFAMRSKRFTISRRKPVDVAKGEEMSSV